MEVRLEQPPGLLARPDDVGSGTGVLVVAGSSGRVDEDRVRLLARHGAVAMSIQWFGGPGQPPGICEVPLETFSAALDLLEPHCDRLAVIGTSKGAEAALLLGVHDPRVDVVAAFAPTHVAWANVGPGIDGQSHPYRSSWTLDGAPVPFVPYDETWSTDEAAPAFRELYRSSLERFPAEARAAAIPVERIRGEVLVVAGGDDLVWPAADHAREIQRRRDEAGLETTVLTDARAGHRTVLPGETPPSGGMAMQRGGTPEADAALGAAAWGALTHLLGLRVPRRDTVARA